MKFNSEEPNFKCLDNCDMVSKYNLGYGRIKFLIG